MLRSTFVSSAVAAVATPTLSAPRAGDLLSAAHQVADLDQLVDTLLEVGAQPFRTSSERDFLSRAGRLRTSMRTPRTVREFYLTVAPLFARLNDGHCKVVPTFYYDAIKRGDATIFPLVIQGDGDELVVFADLSTHGQIPRGSRLISVNGVPAATIRVDARALAGGQTEALRAFAAPYGDSIALRYPRGGAFDVHYTTPDGEAGAATVALQPASSFDRPPAPVASPVAASASPSLAGTLTPVHAPRLPRGPYAYGTIAAGGIGYLAYRACQDVNGMEVFAQATFARIATDHPRALVVDVRHNGGGDSDVNDVLLSYLTGKPYAQSGRAIARVSGLLKREYGHAKFASIYGEGAWTARNGTLYEYAPDALIMPKPNPLRFAGPVYVLMGPGTFSSAMQFGLAIKDFGLATLVGEETGEPAISTGEIATATARYSRLEASFTTKVFFPPKPHPDGAGVVPDLIVRTTIEDGLAGRDPVLAATVARISINA